MIILVNKTKGVKMRDNSINTNLIRVKEQLSAINREFNRPLGDSKRLIKVRINNLEYLVATLKKQVNSEEFEKAEMTKMIFVK